MGSRQCNSSNVSPGKTEKTRWQLSGEIQRVEIELAVVSHEIRFRVSGSLPPGIACSVFCKGHAKMSFRSPPGEYVRRSSGG